MKVSAVVDDGGLILTWKVGKKRRFVGVHIDHPWSEDVRNYGAPVAIYVHWWPGKCWRGSVWRGRLRLDRYRARFYGPEPEVPSPGRT